jgi:transmembrane sensor
MTDRRPPRTEDVLRVPLSLELRDPVREPQVARMWSKIQARRASSRTPMRSVMMWAAVGALLGISVMLALEGARNRARHPVAVEPSLDPGPLLLSNHTPIQKVDVPVGGRSRGIELADGSHIQLEPASQLETLASSTTEVVFRVAFGRAVFDVVPGGPRRWVVEAGLARVEVVGTRFGVTRTPELVHVDVTRGVVLVRGATVPDGVVRVEAGGELDVVPRSESATPAPSGSDSANGHGGRAPHVRPVAGWRTCASGGRYAEAYAALGEGGVGRETARSDSADELLALADVARLSGHPAEAVEPLQRILREHAASAGAPLAAMTLGRIQLGLNEPAEAARAFERALSLRVPAGLEEDVYARLVEAHARAGDHEGAAAAVREYQRRFPAGRRSADVLRWSRE